MKNTIIYKIVQFKWDIHFISFCLKWSEYSISTMQKKKKTIFLMSNSCLNTLNVRLRRKKIVLFFTLVGFLFYFLFSLNLKKKRLMGDWKTWLFIANLGKWQTTFLYLVKKPEFWWIKQKKKKYSNYRLSP